MHFKNVFTFITALSLLSLFAFSGRMSGTKREGGRTKPTQLRLHACDWELLLCSQKRNVEKPVFKTPYINKTLQSNMAYSDAFTMKLLVIHPTRLLLCNSICYFDGISLPPLPPNNSTNCRFLPCIIYCFIVNFYSCFSNFFLIFKWRSVPYSLT